MLQACQRAVGASGAAVAASAGQLLQLPRAPQRRGAVRRQLRPAVAVPEAAAQQVGKLAQSPGQTPVQRKPVAIFNRKVKALQRARAARISLDDCRIFEVVADICLERLSYIQREFPTVLELGCHRGVLSKKYLQSNPPGLKHYIQCDMSREMLDSCFEETRAVLPPGVTYEQRVIDEDQSLPLDRRSVNLCISSLALHWVNDIEATLKQLRTVLHQDGVVYLNVWGGRTLEELQSCFTVAEQERDGGVSPHVSPFLTGPSMGDLFSNAGYNFPTVDVDKFKFFWKTPFHLFEWIQLIGEQNCLFGRRHYVPKDTLVAAAALYDHLWREDEGVPSSFEVIHGIGWAPHPGHKEPSKRGSGSINLKDLAETLGEEVIEEDSDVDTSQLTPEERERHRDVRREQIERLLETRGIRQQRLQRIAELVKLRADGNNDPEVEAEIMRLRQTVQHIPEDPSTRVGPRQGDTLVPGGYMENVQREGLEEGGERAKKAGEELDRMQEERAQKAAPSASNRKDPLGSGSDLERAKRQLRIM